MIHNWTEVLTKAWSVYLLAIITALQFLPEVLATAAPDFIPTELTLNWITGVAGIAAIIARLLKQENLSPVAPE